MVRNFHFGEGILLVSQPGTARVAAIGATIFLCAGTHLHDPPPLETPISALQNDRRSGLPIPHGEHCADRECIRTFGFIYSLAYQF